ncbi:hypothetical protein LCGC14_1841330 [marine sediment metagenome]|uniref:Uncharacterized protein n=1 Tax=marine sediment metagenome TaxID=412755 RepID=A0A0F9JCM7_9ZZZZ
MTQDTTTTLPKSQDTPLRGLHDTRQSIQKARVQMGNRISALEKGVDTATDPIPEVYTRSANALEGIEHDIDLAIIKELGIWHVWNAWLCHVKGIGPSLAGQMLALLLPPLAERGPSTWYKAAGLAPELRPDGTYRLPRARAGEGKTTHHRMLRRCLYNVGTSFVRNGGFYREQYDTGKRRLFRQHMWDGERLLAGWESVGVEARPAFMAEHFSEETLRKAWKPADKKKDGIVVRTADEVFADQGAMPTMALAVALTGLSDEQWPMHRLESASRWRMVKLFLSHLWEEWLITTGVATADQRQAYVLSMGGHHYIAPPQYDGENKI